MSGSAIARALRHDRGRAVAASGGERPRSLRAALMERAGRLVYLSSGMQMGGDASLEDLQWENRMWNGSQAYADTKFHDVLLAFGIARRRPDVLCNALEPGWV